MCIRRIGPLRHPAQVAGRESRPLRSRARLGLVAVVTGLALLPVTAVAQWSDLGLSGREVTRLRSGHGFLYACTSDGLHRKPSDTPDSAWVLLGFAGQRVYDVLAVSAETLIVARQITSTGADTVALLRSTDGGTTWSAFQNGLGALGSAADRKVTALLGPPALPGTVLAGTQNGIYKSSDGGLSWKNVSFGGRFFFLSAGASTLWGGGEGTSFGPIARRSTDGGESWVSSFTSGIDNTALAMAFDPSDPNVAFLGLAYGLYRTTDDGLSWVNVPLPLGVGSSALGNRAFAPLRLYANGDAPPGGATLFKSDDGGSSWNAVSFPAAGSTFEWTILVRSGPAADTVFLGTGSGVLRYVEVELVSVDAAPPGPRLELQARPNPFRGRTALTLRLPRALQVSILVLDSSGRAVARLFQGHLEAGTHELVWNPRGLPAGAYFCYLRAGRQTAVRRLLVLR